MEKNMLMNIPEYVQEITKKLEKAGFAAYIVGGCVRDLLLGRTVKDWDITTNARPEEILKVFPKGKYENKFGTVLVPTGQKIDNGKQATEKNIVEITTYRSEQGYSDRRHPDEIKFEDSLDKDLERRDFTINAMAIGRITHNAKRITPESKNCYELCDTRYAITDLFGGRKDLEKKIIRAVGEPEDRFKEDALRLMRAISFSCQLNFVIEPKTERAIKKMAGGIKFVSQERIRDELVKILESDRAYEGIMFLHNNKILQYILPELERGVGVDQNRHHIYTVF
ncbi:MAG: hypothetical protein PHR36_05355, partial [Patescibacteria group bacterium]|nr:hypothetical protein [Patescibacteria group bacterium]